MTAHRRGRLAGRLAVVLLLVIIPAPRPSRHFSSPALGWRRLAPRARAPLAPRLRDTPATVVAVVGADGRLDRLTAAPDDLYVLDGAAAHVRRYMLHGLPYAEQFTQVMRWREGADGLIMGRPLDLCLAGERLLILDSYGMLWSYWGPAYARTLAPLRLQSDQGALTAVALHGDALLLLDPSRGQVWAYALAGAGYETPRPLLPHPLPLLAAAMRLVVTAASLLVLRADGSLLAIPWTHPAAVARVRLPVSVRAVTTTGGGRLVVASAQEVALAAPDGTLTWRHIVPGLDGQSIRDVAVGYGGRLYVLTATRVLLLDGRVPA